MHADSSTLDRALAELLADGNTRMGQVVIDPVAGGDGYRLRHRDDTGLPAETLRAFARPEDAEEIARYDDGDAYRPLKTAPNLRHGWQLELTGLPALRLALDCFYPGRLSAFLAWKKSRLPVTPLRETLARQTGMYRVTQKITDEQAVALVGGFCRSDGGCARTILWGLGGGAAAAPSLPSLPPEKFDPSIDQIIAGSSGDRATTAGQKSLPMLCQEACNLLVAEARSAVKGKKPSE